MVDWIVRTANERDRRAAFAIAQRLDKWFNAQGLLGIEADLAAFNVLVAVAEEQVLGFLIWRMSERADGELRSMGVEEEFHGLGIGASLVHLMEEGLRNEGAESVFVSTLAATVEYEPYEGTRNFYRARGFKEVRVDKDYWAKGEDRLLMVLDLKA